MTNHTPDTEAGKIAEARRREMAVEHLLFGALRYMAHRDPGLIAELESSLEHLWDNADDGTRDDEAVRAIARKFIKSLKVES